MYESFSWKGTIITFSKTKYKWNLVFFHSNFHLKFVMIIIFVVSYKQILEV